MIGDLHTTALVGRDGSIDWLCLPHFASDACFAKLLGDESNGFWRIAPVDGRCQVDPPLPRRDARPRDRVHDPDGTRPAHRLHADPGGPSPGGPHRRSASRATSTMRMDLCIRFGYGQVLPWVTRCENLLTGTAGPDSVALWTLAETRGEDMRTVSEFSLGEGQHVPFVLTWFLSHELPPRPVDPWYSVEATAAWWAAWSAGCTYEGDHAEAVLRSLITLKALTYEPTGGIVAAPTTSLPEASAATATGTTATAGCATPPSPSSRSMRGGLPRRGDGLARLAAAGRRRATSRKLQIMYGAAGERRLDEWEVDWLAGYESSKPGADRQRRVGPVPARRLRRGDGGPVHAPASSTA